MRRSRRRAATDAPSRPAGEALASRPFEASSQTGSPPAGHPLDRYLAQRKALVATATAALVIQRSKFTGHQSSGTKETPNAILEKELGKDQLFRLKAVPRGTQEETGSEDEEEQTGLWVHPQSLPRKQVDRAEKVSATLEGERRTPGTRKSAAMQTEIGSLGEQERALLGRSPEKSYEGGHLIGDQFLGEDSYKEWNLAPQARKLNNPYYKEVEGMLATGLVDKKTARPNVDIPIQATVEVTYTEDPYDVTIKELVDRKVITPQAAKGKDENKKITFPRFVPAQWTLDARFDEKYADQYQFPDKTLTEKMGKMTTNKPPLKRVPSQESLTIPSDLKSIDSGKFVLGGGKALTLKAFQHFPHPENQAKGTKLELGKLMAPPRLKTRFEKPMNVLNLGEDENSFLDSLGSLDEVENDSSGWAAAGYYITEAARKKRPASKIDLLAKAEDVFRAENKSIFVNGTVLFPKELRNKMKEILLYDSFIKGTLEDVALAEQYEDVEYIGYAEDVDEEEDSVFSQEEDVQEEPPKTEGTRVEKRKLDKLLATVPEEEIEDMEKKKQKVETPLELETGPQSGGDQTTLNATIDVD